MAASPNPALVTWPYARFGTPLQNPGLSVDDPVVRNAMERGFRSRQRFLDPHSRGQYRVLLTNEQYLYFRAWHKYRIKNGTEWFNFRVRAGDGMSWEEVRMTGMYQPSQEARFTRVTFDIVQRTDATPSESSLDSYLA